MATGEKEEKLQSKLKSNEEKLVEARQLVSRLEGYVSSQTEALAKVAADLAALPAVFSLPAADDAKEEKVLVARLEALRARRTKLAVEPLALPAEVQLLLPGSLDAASVATAPQLGPCPSAASLYARDVEGAAPQRDRRAFVLGR